MSNASTTPPTRKLLAQDTPFIDLRAPAEFDRGTLPGAVNLPLLTDCERAEVGATYKGHGQAAAVALGHRLVAGATRTDRTQLWRRFVDAHPGCWLYCWRGGMRSQIAQRWLAECGRDIPRVAGGFKALRETCLNVLEEAPKKKRWLVLAGRTGSGKTELLREFEMGVDLEGLANHRGSAFGARPRPQPAPVSFENSLAVAFLKHRHSVLLLEDESRTIGRLALPKAWYEQMQRAPLAVVEVSLAARVANIKREYVLEPLADGAPAEELQQRYGDALSRIERRLGGLRHGEVQQTLARGFATGAHEAWIERLLTWYYDPMYDYQLGKKLSRVLQRGETSAIRKFIAAY